MDKKKKGGPKIWSRQQERILQKWGEAAACYRYMHNQAFLTYKKSSMRFTIPVIVLSTVTGTANFAQSSFPPSMRSSAPALIGFLNLFFKTSKENNEQSPKGYHLSKKPTLVGFFMSLRKKCSHISLNCSQYLS